MQTLHNADAQFELRRSNSSSPPPSTDTLFLGLRRARLALTELARLHQSPSKTLVTNRNDCSLDEKDTLVVIVTTSSHGAQEWHHDPPEKNSSSSPPPSTDTLSLGLRRARLALAELLRLHQSQSTALVTNHNGYLLEEKDTHSNRKSVKKDGGIEKKSRNQESNWCPKRCRSKSPRATLHRAFHEWSSVSSVRFEEVSEPPANIVIGFERGRHQDAFPFDGKDGVVAHAFYPRDGRLHFDADEDWTLNSDQGVNLFQ
ncbi:Matrixin, partial [Teladorsagia circumcincta]